MKPIRTEVQNDLIKMKGMMVTFEQKNTTEKSRLFCDKIIYMHDRDGEYFDHHLMFYNDAELILKIWLPNNSKDKEFKDIHEALKSVGMKVYNLSIKQNEKTKI